MEKRLTVLERAFELARSGKCLNVSDILKRLKSERYAISRLEGLALKKQLMALIEEAGRSSLGNCYNSFINRLVYSSTLPHKMFNVCRSHHSCGIADDEGGSMADKKSKGSVSKIMQAARDARANESEKIMQVAAATLIQTILEAGDSARRI